MSHFKLLYYVLSLALSFCVSSCIKKEEKQNTSDNAYQEALSQNIGMVKEMEKVRVSDEKEREKNDDNFKKRGDVLLWLQGTWEYRGDVVCRLAINYKSEVYFYTHSGINDKGCISDLNINEGRMSFGEHSYVEFDYPSRSLYYSRIENKCFRKISNEPLLCFRNMSSRTSSSSYGSSSNGFSSDSRLMTKFNKLNEEGRRLTDEIGQYYYSGQAGPWVITDVYRLKQIQDEKIGLAQEMGDRQLEALCRQQKAQTLIALRQMGF